MIITDYFMSVARSLKRHDAVVQVDEPREYLVSDDFNGLLKCRVHYHPEVITFPHHKHLGGSAQISPTDQPTISQVLNEIG